MAAKRTTLAVLLSVIAARHDALAFTTTTSPMYRLRSSVIPPQQQAVVMQGSSSNIDRDLEQIAEQKRACLPVLSQCEQIYLPSETIRLSLTSNADIDLMEDILDSEHQLFGLMYQSERMGQQTARTGVIARVLDWMRHPELDVVEVKAMALSRFQGRPAPATYAAQNRKAGDPNRAESSDGGSGSGRGFTVYASKSRRRNSKNRNRSGVSGGDSRTGSDGDGSGSSGDLWRTSSQKQWLPLHELVPLQDVVVEDMIERLQTSMWEKRIYTCITDVEALTAKLFSTLGGDDDEENEYDIDDDDDDDDDEAELMYSGSTRRGAGAGISRINTNVYNACRAFYNDVDFDGLMDDDVENLLGDEEDDDDDDDIDFDEGGFFEEEYIDDELDAVHLFGPPSESWPAQRRAMTSIRHAFLLNMSPLKQKSNAYSSSSSSSPSSQSSTSTSTSPRASLRRRHGGGVKSKRQLRRQQLRGQQEKDERQDEEQRNDEHVVDSDDKFRVFMREVEDGPRALAALDDERRQLFAFAAILSGNGCDLDEEDRLTLLETTDTKERLIAAYNCLNEGRKWLVARVSLRDTFR